MSNGEMINDSLLTDPDLTFDAQKEGRLLILNYLKQELIGPVGGPSEEIEGEPPQKRYTMGILFPVEASIDKETEGEEEEVIYDESNIEHISLVVVATEDAMMALAKEMYGATTYDCAEDVEELRPLADAVVVTLANMGWMDFNNQVIGKDN